MNTDEYRQHFDSALHLARDYGFATPVVMRKPAAPILDQMLKDKLWAVAAPPVYPFEAFVGGCLHISYNVRAEVSMLLNSPVYLTIGAVSVGDKEGFAFGADQIQKWISQGVSMPLRDIHAWFTLPSMEILDYTFMFTYHAAFGRPMGGPIFLRPDELDGMSYRPILVADNFAERVGATLGYWM